MKNDLLNGLNMYDNAGFMLCVRCLAHVQSLKGRDQLVGGLAYCVEHMRKILLQLVNISMACRGKNAKFSADVRAGLMALFELELVNILWALLFCHK